MKYWRTRTSDCMASIGISHDYGAWKLHLDSCCDSVTYLIISIPGWHLNKKSAFSKWIVLQRLVGSKLRACYAGKVQFHTTMTYRINKYAEGRANFDRKVLQVPNQYIHIYSTMAWLPTAKHKKWSLIVFSKRICLACIV